MPRSHESSLGDIPGDSDQELWRHHGDGTASKVVTARLQAWNSTSLAYEDVELDAFGDLIVTGGGAAGLTDAQLRATPVPVDTELPAAAALADSAANPTVPAVGAYGLVWNGATWDRVTQPLTNAQLRASPVPVSGTVTANAGAGPFPVSDNSGSLTVDAPVGTPVFVRLSDGAAAIVTLPVSGPLTDTQLRAAPVPVSGTVTASGPLTDTQLRASAVPVSGPLTDAQLRATAVPVSGTVTATTGGLTDAQLRAAAVPVSLATSTVSGVVGAVAVTSQDSDLLVEMKKQTTLLSLLLMQFNLNASDIEGVF